MRNRTNNRLIDRLIATLTLSLSLVVSVKADLVDWRLQEVTGPTVNNSVFAGVDSGLATTAAHISVTSLITASSSAAHTGLVWSSGNPGPGKLNLQRWDHPADNPVSFGNGNGNPNNWLQFSLSADPGFFFDLTSVNLSAWRNGSGAPANWAIQYFDGSNWVNFGSTHTEANAGDFTFRNVTFNGSVTASQLDIRFVAFGPTGGTGNLHINQLKFNGTVAAIPEPACGLVGWAWILAIGLRRRS
jgi:hypothetical protein